MFNRQVTTRPTALDVSRRASDGGARRLPRRGRHGRLRHVRLARLRDRREVHPAGRHRARACRPCRARTGSTSTCSCPPAPRRPAAGRWRSSATASATASTARRSSVASTLGAPRHRDDRDQRRRPRRRRRSGTLIVNRDGGAPVDPPRRRPRHRPGRQRHHRLDRRHQRGRRRSGIIGSRDGLRQTVVDLMQLVREIEVGVDVDGDGTADLNADAIYYAGQSFGGIYGIDVPGRRADSPRGRAERRRRLDHRDRAARPVFRALVGIALAARMPSLTNVPGRSAASTRTSRCANLPPVDRHRARRDAPIQTVIDNTEWVQQAGNPVAYAPHIRAIRSRASREVGHPPVRQGRQDRAEPDHHGDHPRRRRSHDRDDALPERPRVRARSRRSRRTRTRS